jgi:hypothetical protein
MSLKMAQRIYIHLISLHHDVVATPELYHRLAGAALLAADAFDTAARSTAVPVEAFSMSDEEAAEIEEMFLNSRCADCGHLQREGGHEHCIPF